MRDGQKKFIKATELVPGDVAILTLGEKIPAVVAGHGMMLITNQNFSHRRRRNS